MKKIILLLSLILVLQLGCTKESIDDNEARNISTETDAETLNILNKSEDISDLVVELFGIDNATTIIFNNKALISVEASYDKDLDGELKEVISKKVIENYPDIEEVKIGDNKRIFSQTENIIISLLQGDSYDNYVKEINSIMEKIDK